MADIAIPPAVFNNLYHHYRTGAPCGGFLSAVMSDKALLSAAQADPINRLHLADIILFNHWAKEYGYLRQIMDRAAFDLKWEAWRIRFSPQATEIELDLEDEE